MKYLIVGSGISGLSIANMLLDSGEACLVVEKECRTGGLIGCTIENGGVLYHRVGGHVFNSKNSDVLNWFWGHFDKDKDFVRASRNAKILISDLIVDYPIECNLYQLPHELSERIIAELLSLHQNDIVPGKSESFGSYLLGKFGKTLYDIYFEPYNKKIWRVDPFEMDLEWLDGKFPRPSFNEIVCANILRKQESAMVHSSFFYPKHGGSQFIVDRLSENVEIICDVKIDEIRRVGSRFSFRNQLFDRLIFTGDLRTLVEHDLISLNARSFISNLNLQSNGTTNVLCECDKTDVSWLYLPSPSLAAHRVIYTGNFSPSNNGILERSSCTVEFSGKHSVENVISTLSMLPGNLKPLAFNYQPNSYVMHTNNTRKGISECKAILEAENVYLLGRFAEWEYYNMDTAIEAAMKLTVQLASVPIKH